MRFRESAKEFKIVKSLVMMAMLLALRLALGFVTTIQISENIKIGFTIFPTTIACMMFGPVPGLAMGGAADILGFIIKPTGAFFPGYTLDSMIAGMIYGWSFYKREKITIIRVVLTLLAVTTIVNLTMTTTWISIQYGVKDFGLFFREPAAAWESFRLKFAAIFTGRLIKNASMLPINSAGVFLLLTAVRKIPFLNREFGGMRATTEK